MPKPPRDPLFGAAVLKLSFILKGREQDPGFRVVYHATLKELGLEDHQVVAYIEANRAQLEDRIKNANTEA